ncbi:MAG: DUF192 domain-containing protein [Planctomycetota bacterium]
MTRTLTIVALLLVAAAAAPPEKKGPPTETVTLAKEQFKLELAADPKAREKGLMGRKKIDVNGGMLFVFPDVRHRVFWMKNCLVDIDLAYLDRDGRIVSLHRMKAELPRAANESERAYERRLRRYVSRRPAQFVIELKAGSFKRLELATGKVVKLDLERLKTLARKNERKARGEP